MRIVISLLLLAILGHCATTWQCNQISTGIPDSVEAGHVLSCFREILQGGEIQEISKLSANLDKKYEKQLMSALEEEIRRLGLLQRQLILGESVLQPVIKWAQNSSHVFINIKTSHRWDSPPCLNSKQQTAFLNESLLEYVNVCVVSQQKLTFRLSINLHKLANIVGEKGENGNLLDFRVSSNGVGMFSAMFEKLEYEIWPFLNRENSSYAIWPEMAERYPEDHRKYEEITKSIAAKQRKPKNKHEGTMLMWLSLLLILLFV